MSDAKRAAMAAHATDLAGVMIRSGGDPRRVRSLLTSARWIVDASGEVDNYRECLRLAGLTPAEVDAAVASIERGEHPAGSLPARVEKMRDDADFNSQENAIAARGHREAGAAHAYRTVLRMLGVKPTTPDRPKRALDDGGVFCRHCLRPCGAEHAHTCAVRHACPAILVVLASDCDGVAP